jgi:hypothetical protein
MRHHEGGFSLLEIVIATGLMLIVTASVFSMMHPAQGAFSTELEAADLQQRLRVAADTLTKDLMMAGAGAYSGLRRGSLSYVFPPVLPFRRGTANDDPAGTFAVDRITVIYVPTTAAQTTLSADLDPASLTLQVTAQTNCPPSVNLCGFTKDMSVLVYDDTGSYDVFPITSVIDGSAQMTISRPADAGATYAAGARVVEAVSHTYYLKTDTTTGISQLMRSDGAANADVPVVDHVVGLTFDYYGEPQPPTMMQPLSEVTGSGTTYGPKPSPNAVAPFAPGENCVFIDDGSPTPAPRLATFGTGAQTLVQLTAARLTDGPWCPNATSANRWDADLLRIRKVTVTLRVETAAAALRGPAGVLFAHGGTSRTAGRWVPDQELTFQISPRNLNLGR